MLRRRRASLCGGWWAVSLFSPSKEVSNRRKNGAGNRGQCLKQGCQDGKAYRIPKTGVTDQPESIQPRIGNVVHISQAVSY